MPVTSVKIHPPASLRSDRDRHQPRTGDRDEIGSLTAFVVIANSEELKPKPGRGGKRKGAGRKPNLAKQLLKGVTRSTLTATVENVDIGAVVLGLLRSKRELTRLETLHFIFDRILGKPKQDVSVSGGLVHAHTRDPRLAALPQDALLELARAYDEVLVKHLLAASPDAPQNQAESKPAIETPEV